ERRVLGGGGMVVKTYKAAFGGRCGGNGTHRRSPRERFPEPLKLNNCSTILEPCVGPSQPAADARGTPMPTRPPGLRSSRARQRHSGGSATTVRRSKRSRPRCT